MVRSGTGVRSRRQRYYPAYLPARTRPEASITADMTPTFSEIANSLIVEGIEPRALNITSDHNFQLHPEAAIKCLRDGADAIFIGRPNSPTGTILKIDESAEIATACESRDCWCVFDEAFIDFVQDARSSVAFAEKNRKYIVLRSLTKIFALPGLRVGCVVGHPDTIGLLREAIEPWSVNAVAHHVSRACLEVADGFVRETRKFVSLKVARITDALSKLSGIHIFPSVANFMIMEVEDELIPGAFGKHMLEHGIRVRDLRGLHGCRVGLYRIGIRSKSDNDRFLQATRAWPS
jgi:threonine-phosphate decarboxylase